MNTLRFRMIAVGLVSLAASTLLASRAAADERPNIVVILCDDMGFSDIGCYGGEIETPNLDRLAQNGLRFTDFHNNAKCSETRASLLTGLWHQQSKNLRQPGHVTLAEVLGAAGYQTLMSGKWHLAKTPRDRGFERYFGFLGGAINFYTGEDWGSGENLMRLEREVYQPPKDFYATDAFTDYALDRVDGAVKNERPFFLYLAYNAPHFPLHALPEDIAKYRGKYAEGWDVIRERRYRRLRELGVIDNTWRMSDRDPKVEAWDELTEQEKEFLEPMMEVYAAMVDRLDQNIGRLVARLEKHGELDNTLILFLSDNGACPYQRLRNNVLTPGPAESDIAYDARWANMCNTPLRLYKQYAHEGGSATPMIAHWPRGIKVQGELTGFTSHLVDVMPTVVDLAGAEYPKEVDGRQVHPMEGVSLVSALKGEKDRGDHPLYWDYSGNHAVRAGDWKLVAERGKDWELYNLAKDRSETQNLAADQPDRVKQLAAKYDAWARRTGAHQHEAASKLKPSTQPQLFDLDAVLAKPKRN
ncbi:MAG: arylsulfatase [Pirellulaceae bacterium]